MLQLRKCLVGLAVLAVLNEDDTIRRLVLPRIAITESGFWEFQGYRTRDGYGRVWPTKRGHLVHRLTYAKCYGPITDDQQIDHLCRNRSCCNPQHLEVVSSLENTRRGEGCSDPVTSFSDDTCPYGHAWTPQNTYVNKRGARQCRTCDRLRHRKRRGAAVMVAMALLGACGQPEERVVTDAPTPAPVITDETPRLVTMQSTIDAQQLWDATERWNATVLWNATVEQNAREEASRRARENARRSTQVSTASSRAQIGTAVGPIYATGTVNGYPCGGELPPCYVLERESGGNPTAENPVSTASGLWQALDSTWAGFGGYSHASYAPPDVQNEFARQLWDGGRGCSHWSACG